MNCAVVETQSEADTLHNAGIGVGVDPTRKVVEVDGATYYAKALKINPGDLVIIEARTDAEPLDEFTFRNIAKSMQRDYGISGILTLAESAVHTISESTLNKMGWFRKDG